MRSRARSATAGSLENMVRLDAARCYIGSESLKAFPADGEGPMRQVTLGAFYISKFAVANRQFAEFGGGLPGHRSRRRRPHRGRASRYPPAQRLRPVQHIYASAWHR